MMEVPNRGCSIALFIAALVMDGNCEGIGDRRGSNGVNEWLLWAGGVKVKAARRAVDDVDEVDCFATKFCLSHWRNISRRLRLSTGSSHSFPMDPERSSAFFLIYRHKEYKIVSNVRKIKINKNKIINVVF